MSICMKTVHFPINLIKSGFVQMSNGQKNLVLACCTTYNNNKQLEIVL